MCFRCGKRGNWRSSYTKFASIRPSQFEPGYFANPQPRAAQGTESTLAVNPLHDVYEDIIHVQLSSNTCEYKQPSSNTPVSSLKVKGRLRAHVQFWKDIEASDFIIDTIQEGYKIPFRESPNPAIFSNYSSAFDNWQFVFDSVTQLLITDRIVQVEEHDLIFCSLLSVATKPCGKQRFILDLRYVNNHIYKQTIKFEDWRTALQYFESGSEGISNVVYLDDGFDIERDNYTNLYKQFRLN